MSVDIQLLRSGKVRDIYSFDAHHLLFKTSDRISAFDVVLPDEIPGKGKLLNDLTRFWMKKFEHIVPNHLTQTAISPPEEFAKPGQLVLVKKLKPLAVEAIVRGYIIGSGWKDYQKTGAICGIPLPDGLQLAQQLPQVIYTPSTKADVGDHDVNISYDETVDILGAEMAAMVRDVAVHIYQEAAAYALDRGIIIADTKFEFGLDEDGTLRIMDEVLTPDSSRFWSVKEYEVGISPPSFDKQIVRDYLETLDWNKKAPGPNLPQEILDKTAAKYNEVAELLIA